MPISEECKEIIKELRELRKLEREQPRIAFFLYSLEMNSERLKCLSDKFIIKYFPPEKKVIRKIHRKLSSASTDEYKYARKR